jgi:hypothetical protein
VAEGLGGGPAELDQHQFQDVLADGNRPGDACVLAAGAIAHRRGDYHIAAADGQPSRQGHGRIGVTGHRQVAPGMLLAVISAPHLASSRSLTDLAVGTAARPPRSCLVTSGKDRVAMLHIVVLAEEDRARVRDYFYLCLGDAASVTPNPEVHARRGLVLPHRPGGTLNRGEVVPEDSHRQSPSTADP